MNCLKANFRKKISDQSGGTVAIFILITLPMFVLLLMIIPELARVNESANVNIKNAVIDSARIAASAVDRHSQASGKPMIDPDRAHEFFIKSLRVRLGLDENLNPISGSRLQDGASVEYYLLVFNGQNADSINGLSRATFFSTNGYALSNWETHDFSGNEHAFFIRKDNNEAISLDSGDIEIHLSTPGVIAVVTAKAKPVFKDEGVEITRWASARIEKK